MMTYYNFDAFSGTEFEYYCAEILKANGFVNVEVTKQSGDDGVDVLAVYENKTYAIQCKRSSSDISNKAVQQVYSGKAIYDRQVAAVITNRHFTKSAIAAAQKLDVMLWDRETLIDLANRKLIKDKEALERRIAYEIATERYNITSMPRYYERKGLFGKRPVSLQQMPNAAFRKHFASVLQANSNHFREVVYKPMDSSIGADIWAKHPHGYVAIFIMDEMLNFYAVWEALACHNTYVAIFKRGFGFSDQEVEFVENSIYCFGPIKRVLSYWDYDNFEGYARSAQMYQALSQQTRFMVEKQNFGV